MNLRERLEIRAVINLVISVIERLVRLFDKYGPSRPKPENNNPTPNKPNRPRPLKKVIDTIDNIVPLPWRK